MRKRVFLLSMLVALGCFFSPYLWAKLSSSEFSRAKKRFVAAVARSMDGEAKDAIQTLASDNSKRAVEVLLNTRVLLAPSLSTPVYNSIITALASMDNPKAIQAMVRKLRGGKLPQKIVVASAFSRMSDKTSGEALVAALKKERAPSVLRTLIQAVAKRKLKKAIPALIKIVRRFEKNKGLTWYEARQGLTAITGYDFPSAEEWEKWWSINEATFDPHAKRGDKKTATVEKKGPRFFTEQIVSKRIVFVIDISGSMQAEDPPTEKGGGGVRIKRAKNELIKVIKSLSKKTKFNIIAFSDRIRPWQKGKLVAASRAAKVSAIRFVQSLKAEGLTRTDKALQEAFKSREANAIYLLSDGAPTMVDKKAMRAVLIPPNKILEEVRRMNRFRKMKIYTMGFAEEAKKPGGEIFVKFLKLLAKENGGRFSPIH